MIERHVIHTLMLFVEYRHDWLLGIKRTRDEREILCARRICD